MQSTRILLDTSTFLIGSEEEEEEKNTNVISFDDK